MALTFPIGLAGFADLLRIESGAFTTPDYHQVTGLGSGQMLTSEFFDPVWRVELQTAPMKNTDARRVMSLARGMMHKDGSFLLYDHKACFPKLDPGGVVLGSNVVTIAGIGGNGRSVQFEGMPSLYRLRVGDRFSVTDGTSVYYGELLEDANANASGLGPFADVFPEFPVWVETGMAVTLKKPYAIMQIRSGTLRMANSGPNRSVVSFEAFEDVR